MATINCDECGDDVNPRFHWKISKMDGERGVSVFYFCYTSCMKRWVDRKLEDLVRHTVEEGAKPCQP